MSQTVITQVFEQWKAQQAAQNKAIELDEFVLANVPGLDPSKPIDRTAGLPDAAQIVHRQAVSKTGLVNANAVVYSVTMGADVGDFSFNWIGLVNKATQTLAMVVHAPTQQKIKTDNGQQGNVLTRSCVMEYNGAANETTISVPAETWQIDFTARLNGVDEMQRLVNLDQYGAAAFFGDGFLVSKTGSQHFITQGVGYIAGLRIEIKENVNVSGTHLPVYVFADVSYSGTLTSEFKTRVDFVVTDSLTDYVENGVIHHVFALARVDENGDIQDLRPKGSLDYQQGAKDYLRKDQNFADVKDKAAARKTLSLDKVGNWKAVQQGGGAGMDDSKVSLGWNGSKLIGEAAGKALGELYYAENQPPYPVVSVNKKIGAVTLGPSDVGALPIEGGTVTANLATKGTLTAGGAMNANSTLGVKGVLTAQGQINANSGLAVKGDVSAGGTLSATGAVTANSTLAVQGELTAEAQINANGGLAVKGDVSAGGTVTATGAVNASSTLGVKGVLTAQGQVNANSGLAVKGNVTAGGTVTATGAVQANSTLGVKGVLTAQGQINANSGLAVKGDVTAQGKVTANNGLDVKGNTTNDGTLTATGAVKANSTLDVAGNATIGGSTTVKGGGSYTATLTMGYRGILSRDTAIPYMTFRRQDVMAAPTADTEIGRVLFGYGMDSTDSWGTGGQLAYLRAVALAKGGAQTFVTALNVNGSPTAQLLLDGNAGEATLTGAVQVNSTLGVKGVLTAEGQVNANSGLAVKGNVTAGGTVTATGAVNANSTLGVKGVLTAQGQVNANSGLAVKGNVTAGGTVTATGAVQANSTLGVKGVLTADGQINANSGLAVTGDVTASGAVTATGAVNANSTLGVKGVLTAQGQVNANSGLAVKGNVTAGGTVTATGAVQANSTLGVKGVLTAQGKINANGGLAATGSVTASGAMTAESVTASKSITAAENITSTKGTVVGLAIKSNGGITAENDITSNKGTVSGVYIKSSGDIKAEGAVNAGGINSSGNVNAGQANYQTDGNIKGGVWNGYLSTYLDLMRSSLTNDIRYAYSPSNPAIPEIYTLGTYVIARSSTGAVGPNTVVSGSNLRASTADGGYTGDALPGSWRCMGAVLTTNDAHRTTLWMRVS